MKIKINHCGACGPQFENLTDGSIHEVIPTPKGESDRRGWWVMGVGEPVLVLTREASIVEY
jgi:hypothetical protein